MLYVLGSWTGRSVAGKIEITPLVMPLKISHSIFHVLWWVIFKAVLIYLLFLASYCITMSVYSLWTFCGLRSKENDDPFVITLREAKKTVQGETQLN